MSDDTPEGRLQNEQDVAATQWWGYGKEHGWVVLDRSIPSNEPGRKNDLLFLRCRDAMTFSEKRERWTPPIYTFAPNHIRDLKPPELAAAAAAELEGLRTRWPEFEREIQRVCREAEERIEAVRVEEEKARKVAASEKRKQTAAARA